MGICKEMLRKNSKEPTTEDGESFDSCDQDAKKNEIHSEAIAERDALKAENEKLRAALESVANQLEGLSARILDPDGCAPTIAQLTYVEDEARAALARKGGK